MITASDVLLIIKYVLAALIVIGVILAPAWLARQTGYDSGTTGQLDFRLDGNRMAVVIILVVKKIKIPHFWGIFIPQNYL